MGSEAPSFRRRGRKVKRAFGPLVIEVGLVGALALAAVAFVGGLPTGADDHRSPDRQVAAPSDAAQSSAERSRVARTDRAQSSSNKDPESAQSATDEGLNGDHTLATDGGAGGLAPSPYLPASNGGGYGNTGAGGASIGWTPSSDTASSSTNSPAPTPDPSEYADSTPETPAPEPTPTYPDSGDESGTTPDPEPVVPSDPDPGANTDPAGTGY